MLATVVADRPRGDDVPLPGARPLTELDGERGEDNDLSEVVDGLDRVRAWAAEHCPSKSGSSDSGGSGPWHDRAGQQTRFHAYEAGHIDGARSIPIDELEQRLAELPPDREVVAYCRGPFCAYAHDAVRRLQDDGRPARRLQDGWPEWRLADKPTKRHQAA